MQDLKQKLSQEFSLLCFEDLALVSADPYFLRSILSTNWQKSYTPHQRFAFFSGQSPDLALLSWIKSICEQCDVSASFILLICPVNITDLINKIFADMDRFQCIVQSVSGGLLTQGYAINDTICVLPWMHLSIYNQGQIHPCCRNTMNMGSIDSHNPREVFNSHDLKNLRLALKSGIRADSCSSCWKVENSGGFSHRQLMLKYHGQKFFSKFLHHPNIQSLDVKTGNTCNFTCRICSPMVSSAIAQESLKHTPDGDTRQNLVNLLNQGRWFEKNLNGSRDTLFSLFDSVEEIEFYGGEPFLSKQLYKVLDKIQELGRCGSIRLHFNSNGSIYPESLIPKLRQFKQIDIGISIDDIGPRFEATRGGRWSEVEDNIRRFQQNIDEQFQVSIFVTVSILNVYYLDELFDWAQKKDLKVLFNFVAEPWYLSIENLTPLAKKITLEKYASSTDPNLSVICQRICLSGTDTGQTFVEKNQRLDKLRNQDLRITHKEIAAAMGYV